jgi:superfamily II DNA or RNA helicase
MYSNFNQLLLEVTGYLARYLDEILPLIFDNWWQDGVLNVLSPYQQRTVKEKDITELASLDLAALLRILDQNWYRISLKKKLSTEERHFVKEMQTVRNRWAHVGADGLPLDDVYRDMDTLQRFASVIEADQNFIQAIQKSKQSLLAMSRYGSNETMKGDNFILERKSNTTFQPGQMVCLKSNPEIQGSVLSLIPGGPEKRYKVFFGDSKRTVYESQLQPVEDEEVVELSCQKFHCYFSAIQINNPGLSTLYSLNAARVNFIPYQFRPVLKFIRSDRPRLLIADGVGVGKTIEAGLIMRELQARREIHSVLIICPRPLVTERKWEREMKRFEEDFIALDGETLHYCIKYMDEDGVWPEQYQKIIVPYSLFDTVLLYGTEQKAKRRRRKRKGLLALDPPPRFDLVIVDEAHHIRNTNTCRYQAVRFFCEHADAVLFLTATPIQIDNTDLFVLLHLLRPDLVIDQKSFQYMVEPNVFINRAINIVRAQEDDWARKALRELEKAASTSCGRSLLIKNPDFSRVREFLISGSHLPEERVQLINKLESLHTFAGIINRTRRRDIGNFTIRKSKTIVIEFTPAQKRFHDDLLLMQAEIYKRLHGSDNVKFMLTTIRRQAASCLFGLIPFLKDILTRHINELIWNEIDNTTDMPSDSTFKLLEADIKRILEQASKIEPEDPKLEALKKIIREKQNLPNNRLMIFSSFRHTLDYLYKNLKADGYRVGLVHGDILDEERFELRNCFALERDNKDALDILLFSEIGSEGLDYQFCDCIVNYDLPWNPMRIEQRIGRIDRWGQQSESISIVNLITEGTVDADIYERCLKRIGIFENALGASEEILGEITRGIRDIAEDFTLGEEERRVKLQQLAENKIRLIQEQEELEKKQIELFGIHLPEKQLQKELEASSSFWLSSDALFNLVSTYLQAIAGKNSQVILGDKPLKTLRLSQKARKKLLDDFNKLTKQKNSFYTEWERWLKGSNQHLTVTFDAECASQHPDAAFIMPLHPLVRQAANAFYTTKKVITAFKVKEQSIAPGRYLFAIYQWRYLGLKDDLILQPVADSPLIASQLFKLLEKAEDDFDTDVSAYDLSVWEELEEYQHKMWSRECEEHKRKTQEMAQYKRESLKVSHQARIGILKDQLNKAQNERIKKMYLSQFENAEADYARRTQELDIAVERAEILSDVVVYGVLRVEG